MDRLPESLERKLVRLGTGLINHKRARVLVEPTRDEAGHWFGGGNAARDPRDGSLLLIAISNGPSARPELEELLDGMIFTRENDRPPRGTAAGPSMA